MTGILHERDTSEQRNGGQKGRGFQTKLTTHFFYLSSVHNANPIHGLAMLVNDKK